MKKTIKKKSTGAGMDYPKHKILELVDIFGFTVDLDRWDEKGKDFMRIVSTNHKDAGSLIVHKHHLEVQVGIEREFLKSEFQKFLMKIGEYEFKRKIHDLFSLDEYASIFNK